jgi:error-prone DNA polymerase
VLVRQRPGTGVVCFVTIEDETGVANLVILPEVVEKHRRTIMGARLLVAVGRIQRSKEGIVHIMVHRLEDRSALLRALAEPEPPLIALLTGGEAGGGSGAARPGRTRSHGHPRNVRILPGSRDFH